MHYVINKQRKDKAVYYDRVLKQYIVKESKTYDLFFNYRLKNIKSGITLSDALELANTKTMAFTDDDLTVYVGRFRTPNQVDMGVMIARAASEEEALELFKAVKPTANIKLNKIDVQPNDVIVFPIEY